MAQPGPGPGQPPIQWIWDPSLQQYYYFEIRTNEYIYQDGTRRPAASIPRFSAEAADYTPQYGSPPRDHNYSHTAPGRQSSDLAGAMGSLSLGAASRPPPVSASASASATSVGAATARPGVRQYNLDGLEVVDAEDPRSLVRNRYATAPVERITDPALYRHGVRAHRMLYATGNGTEERLYTQYRLQGHKFFKLGRVFQILWSEPAGELSGSAVTNFETSDRSITHGAFGERVHSKTRRFIVIREGNDYCSACPISTYSGRGVSKPGVTKADHAIVYTGREVPQPKVHENPQRGEAGMRPNPIRVNPDDPVNTLDPMSRVDFGKVHTIQHNVKVRPVGLVHPDSQAALTTQFANVWMSSLTPAQPDESSRSAAASALGATSAIPGTSSYPAASSSRRMPPPSMTAEKDDGDDDGDAVDNAYVVTSRQQSYQTQPSGSAAAQKSSTPASQASSRPPASSYQGAGSTSSSGSDAQSSWTVRVQGAQAAYRRLLDGGYTREQAVTRMINELVQQGLSASAARAEIHTLLSGRPPS